MRSPYATPNDPRIEEAEVERRYGPVKRYDRPCADKACQGRAPADGSSIYCPSSRHSHRYAVCRVDLAGVSWEVARSRSAIAALDVAESYPSSRTSTTFAYDADDPESGNLYDGHPAVEREWDDRAEAAGFPLEPPVPADDTPEEGSHD